MPKRADPGCSPRGHWQDRPPTGLLGSGPTIKVLVGALDGKGDAGSEREGGARVCLQVCSHTHVSGSFPFPHPSSFHWGSSDHTSGLK